jgi:signal transduction histidine kinase
MLSNTAVLVHAAGGRDLQREGMAVDAFVTETLDTYPAVAGIELRHDLDCADQIFADRGAMRQALVALLDNAVESLRDPDWTAPAGHRPQCLVSTQFITTHVLLTVSDNGPGITRDIGPGLSTARQIVEQHGGTLDVHSDVGDGTTVTMWLPRHRAARPTVRVAAAA